ncbi:MAG: T9SS type A sorting domain-containing protein [Fimbriimonadaceae bacterium]|nr:T9SS type A sorting domain-containing protein [Chitinophagales bacterium]
MKQLVILFLAISFQSVSGQKYDSTFNGNGFVTGATLYEGLNMIEEPTDVIYESTTGKIVMLNQFNWEGATLHRFNSDGSYDIDFGTDGIQEYYKAEEDEFINVFETEDGYMLTGRTSPEYGVYSPILEEIQADGNVNTAFGIDGINAVYSIDSLIVRASYKGASGRYILIGNDVDWYVGGGIMVFNADGSYDAGFGYQTLNISGELASISFECVLELPDGRILVGGNADIGFDVYQAFTVCYLANGIIDESFGENGFLYPEPEIVHGNSSTQKMTIDADGNIYAAGFITTLPGTDYMVIKFNDSGEIDAGFGSSGYVYLDGEGGLELKKLDVNSANQLYVLGVDHPEADATLRTTIYKLLETGEPDPAFTNGVPGQFLIEVPGTDSDNDIEGRNMIIQADGKLVIIGNTDGLSANDDFWIGRITTNETPVDVINENEMPKNISIFPNPASNYLDITSDVNIESATIFSLDGKQIKSIFDVNDLQRVDVSDLEPGCYVLEVKLSENEISSLSFIKESL